MTHQPPPHPRSPRSKPAPLPLPHTPEVPLDDDERTFLSAREVAVHLRRSLVTLERWRRTRRGPPFVRIGGTRVSYPADALRRWIAEQSSK